jgi:hypothetical protein
VVRVVIGIAGCARRLQARTASLITHQMSWKEESPATAETAGIQTLALYVPIAASLGFGLQRASLDASMLIQETVELFQGRHARRTSR